MLRRHRIAVIVIASTMAAALGASLTPGFGAAHRSTTKLPHGSLMTGQDFLDAGLPIPGMHPTLPICPPSITDRPDQSAPKNAAEAAAIVPAPATCQADMRRAVFTPSLPRHRVAQKRGTTASVARPLHSPGHHWAGPNHPPENMHGVKASIT